MSTDNYSRHTAQEFTGRPANRQSGNYYPEPRTPSLLSLSVAPERLRISFPEASNCSMVPSSSCSVAETPVLPLAGVNPAAVAASTLFDIDAKGTFELFKLA